MIILGTATRSSQPASTPCGPELESSAPLTAQNPEEQAVLTEGWIKIAKQFFTVTFNRTTG